MNEEEMRTWLSGFYAHAAKGFEMQNLDRINKSWDVNEYGPNAASDPDEWRIKPALKVIDLGALVGSGILCEFWTEQDSRKRIGLLRDIVAVDDRTFFRREGAGECLNCIPLMNHIHFWAGGDKCPVPEGFEVRLYFREGHFRGSEDSPMLSCLRWGHSGVTSDIIGIEFLKVKDDYTIGQGE